MDQVSIYSYIAQRVKINFSPEDKIALVPIFPILPKGAADPTFSKEIAAYNARMGTQIDIKRGLLRIASVMPKLFEEQISKIINHVSKLLKLPDLQNVRYLFLVGGFAESQILQNSMRENFKDKLKVVIPPRPGTAVMNGAVLFGLNPGNFLQ